MASYKFKQFFHGANVGTAVPNDTFNLVTAPVGHNYLIKKATLRYNKGAGGAVTLRFFLTDTAGANPRPVTGLQTTGAAAESQQAELTGISGTTVIGVDSGAMSIENLLLEAGQILQLTTTAGGAVAITTQVIISGVDYTI